MVFDPAPESIIDIKSYGEDDFVVVGYNDGRPYAFTKDATRYPLDLGLGTIKKVIVKL